MQCLPSHPPLENLRLGLNAWSNFGTACLLQMRSPTQLARPMQAYRLNPPARGAMPHMIPLPRAAGMGVPRGCVMPKSKVRPCSSSHGLHQPDARLIALKCSIATRRRACPVPAARAGHDVAVRGSRIVSHTHHGCSKCQSPFTSTTICELGCGGQNLNGCIICQTIPHILPAQSNSAGQMSL